MGCSVNSFGRVIQVFQLSEERPKLIFDERNNFFKSHLPLDQ